MKKRNRRGLLAVLLAFVLMLSMQMSVFAESGSGGGSNASDTVTAEESLDTQGVEDSGENVSGETGETEKDKADAEEAKTEESETDSTDIREESTQEQDTQEQNAQEGDSGEQDTQEALQETGDGSANVASDSESGVETRSISGPTTVNVGSTITLTSSVWGYTSNHRWSSSDKDIASVSGSNSRATVTGVSEGSVRITHTYRNWRGKTESEYYNVTVTRPGTIEAKVYLRYSNEVPDNINSEFATGEFGPAGNNTPYITVTVDLGQVSSAARSWNSGSFTYYSIDSDSSHNVGSDRKANAENFWNKVIYPAIEESDRADLDEIFGGEGNFIGYVLKIENDGWHIDGVLSDDPPVYVVELYDENDNVLFAISNNNEERPGLSYREDFKTRLEETLGGTGYTYVTEENDNIVVIYTKDGAQYQSTITPRQDSSSYHIYPNGDQFGYREVTADIYYLCRLVITTEQVSGDLTISKTVSGSAANPEEHFTFNLYQEGLNGSYAVTYTGTEGCGTSHGGTITFSNGSASLQLRHGEAAVITGLSGTVNIKEADNTSYQTSVKVDGSDANYTDSKGVDVSVGKDGAAADFTNTKDAAPLTGVHMSSTPYIVAAVLVIAAAAGFLFVGRKKKLK